MTRMKPTHCLRLMLAILLLPVGRLGAAEALLIAEGKIRTAVVVSEALRQDVGAYGLTRGRRPESYLALGIADLQEHLRLLGEGELVVVDAPGKQLADEAAKQVAAGRTPIVLAGPDFDADLHRALLGEVDELARQRDRLVYTGGDADAVHPSVIEHGIDPESFALRVRGNIVTIQGLSPKGVLNGMYELLEQLGFRWYMPGEFGLVRPSEQKSHALPQGTSLQVPSFTERMVTTAWPVERDWIRRLRVHAVEWSIGHAMPNPSFEEHPEFFALRDGERRKGRWTCVSNPEYVEWMAEYYRKRFRENPDEPRRLALMPPDGGSFCQCENCRALDAPVNTSLQTPRQSVTDRYIWFNNQVLERLEDEFPEVRAGFLIYAGLMDPPVRLKPHPKIFGSIAEIHVCRYHGPNNPNCPESDYLLWLMREWGQHLAWFRNSGYWFILGDPGLPNMMIGRMRDEIPAIHAHGSIGIRRSAGCFWANEGPSLYLAMKLKWDVKTDVDALLEEFFTRFYGPAAGPMRRYTMLLDRVMYETDFHAGRSWDILHIYDAAVREAAVAALAEAARLAPATDDNLYAMRVEVATKGWRYFEAYAAMVEHRQQCDFVASMKAVERARALIEDLTTQYEYPMLRTRPGSVSSERFFNRLWGHAAITEAGYERVTGGNELVAGCDPVWDFLLEPQGIGERFGLENPANTGGNWRAMDTRYTWSYHGLRYYYGEAWYRQNVKVPAQYAGRKLMLWFSSIDNGGKVWLNGKLLGTSPGAEFDLDAHGGSLSPFEFDISDAFKPGEENTIVVRAIRDRANEIGTGGIMGPVMIYAADD